MSEQIGYFIDTNPAGLSAQEPVVPEGAEDLLQSEQSAEGGCCGGACCS